MAVWIKGGQGDGQFFGRLGVLGYDAGGTFERAAYCGSRRETVSVLIFGCVDEGEACGVAIGFMRGAALTFRRSLL